MKNFILTPDMLCVLGDDISPERKNAVTKALTNNWAFLVYPESAPENWIDILQQYYIPFSVSPLHDKDINPDGNPKKPHYHVLLTSDSKKSFTQLFEIAKSVNGSFLINVGNVKGYYRYLIHLDNPEKFQYDENDIKHYVGFNPDNYTKASSAFRIQALKQMIQFIEENNILDYCDFTLYCLDSNNDEWFRLLADSCSVFIKSYLDSRRKKFLSSLGDNRQKDYV